MARDLDFVRSRPRNSTPVEARVVSQPNAPATTAARSNSKFSWLVLLLILLGIALLIAGIYWQLTSTNRAVTTPTPTVKKPVSVSPPTEDRIFAGSNQDLNVQIYDSGAGPAAVGQVIRTLEDGRYKVTDLSHSQFDYDQTLIWYKKGFRAQAEQVASLLKSRDVNLTESKIGGVFDVLIFLGKK